MDECNVNGLRGHASIHNTWPTDRSKSAYDSQEASGSALSLPYQLNTTHTCKQYTHVLTCKLYITNKL